jgi:DNA modification methylase
MTERAFSKQDAIPAANAHTLSRANDLLGASLAATPQVEILPVTSLRPPERRIRVHDATQRRQMKASLEKFGQVIPVLIDGAGTIIDGLLVYETVMELGYSTIQAIRTSHLSPGATRALRLSLNKLAESGDWNPDELRLELNDLIILDSVPDFTLPGFETAELDRLFMDETKDRQVDEDDVIPRRDAKQSTVSRSGDLWAMGDHRLLCADALEESSYETLLRGTKAAMIITDPPYNVPIQGHVSGLGRARHKEFAMASGEMSSADFTHFLSRALTQTREHAAPGALLHVFMDWRHMPEILTASKAAELAHINLCVWVKDNGGMGSLYRSQHELVFILKKQGAPHQNNVNLGKHGRYRTNVWRYRGLSSMHDGRDEALAVHPTVKPVAMIADAICDSTRHGDTVLDPFAGSGTIFLAAERTGRKGLGIEIDPDYCDTILDRWERSTGREAIHTDTGLTRKSLAKQRPKARERRRIQSVRGEG